MKKADVGVALYVLAAFVMFIVPIPSWLLDIFLAINISIAFTIMFGCMFSKEVLDLSYFPTILLFTTIFRIALNISSTRLILTTGEPGNVVETFGQYVGGGDLTIGVIVFIILIIIQFMVINKGSERVAEVTARFTLDAMPGKQMAIEADLNSGIITEQEAIEQRKNIRREADFYGAMDGAGKFVQGDVTAGMFITFINIIGGIIIGVWQFGLSFPEALQTYSLLTIGDGLVSTIPSIIISVSAGIIVSRAAAESKMGEEFLTQLTYNSKVLKIVSGILFLLGIVPGLPLIPFWTFSVLLFITTRILGDSNIAVDTAGAGGKKALGSGAGGSKAIGQAGAAPENLDSPEEVQKLLPLDLLELEVGYGLIPLVDEEQNGNLLSRIRSIRRQFALDMGVVIPALHLRDNLQLRPGQYSLLIKGNQIATAEILIDHYLAMDPGNATKKIEGIETMEPAFSLPALWITEMQKEDAMVAGYTVVDPATVIATHITEVFRRNLSEFLGRQEVQSLLDTLAKTAPRVVDELVPNVLQLGQVQKVLQNLVRENVSIRDMLTIIETLADYGQANKNPDTLTEFVRERMARTIIRPYLDEENALVIMTLDPQADRVIQESIRTTDGGAFLALNPAVAQKFIANINRVIDSAVMFSSQPVLLTSPMIRPHVAQLVTRFLPNVPVLSQVEIPADIRLHSAGTVGIE